MKQGQYKKCIRYYGDCNTIFDQIKEQRVNETKMNKSNSQQNKQINLIIKVSFEQKEQKYTTSYDDKRMFSQENQYIYLQTDQTQQVSQLKTVKQDRNIIMSRQRMCQSSTSQLARFYVEFINNLMGMDTKKITGLGQLRDGVVLCEILSHVEGMELRGRYNEDPVGFVQILGNMKQVLKGIESYWNRVLGIGLEEEMELISVCKGGQQDELMRLVKLVIRTLLLSPQKEQYIEHILQTSQQAQTYFMQLISQQSTHHQPTTSFSNTSINKLLYRRLQQVERQNQKLLKVVQQLQQQLTSTKQLSRECDQKNRQQQRMISTLSQQVKLLKIHFYENQQQQQELQLLSCNQQKLQSKMQENMVEFCEQEGNMRKQIQRLKSLVQGQVVELQYMSKRNSQLSQYKARHQQLVSCNQLLSDKLQKLQAKLMLLQKQLQLSQQANTQYQEQTLTLRKALFQSENLVKQKNELIEQLDNNIKYLLEQSQPNTINTSSSSPLSSSQPYNIHPHQSSSTSHNTTTLKQEFQSVIISNRQHFILTKLTEQNILLNKQLKSTKQDNNKLQTEIQQLAVIKQENSKLVQMITHMHNYRGEENQLLIKTIYRMRMNMLKKEFIQINNINNSEDHVLKDINRQH